jgi:site-specific DNA-methyltransferase (adenine-specific)
MLEVNRIYNGDSLEVLKGVENKSIDLILTDVPYNISQKSNGLRKLDYGEWDKQIGMESLWMAEMIRVCRGTIISFCGIEQISGFTLQLKADGFSTRSIVWHKSNPNVINCNRLYVESTEFAVYGKRPKATYNNKYKHNLFNYPVVRTNRTHPSQKPLKLFEELILDTTNERDIVLDPFLGSGTTIEACLKTKRNFIGIERNEEYYLKSLKRMEDIMNV